MPVQSIIDHCGLPVTRYEPVHGGDINRSYCLHGTGIKYFLKLNDADRYPGMFEKEAGGLAALRSNPGIFVPQVIACGSVKEEQFLLLEWIEKGIPAIDHREKFGTSLAAMHRHPQPFFGWKENNFIGSLPQDNTAHTSWHTFFTECRVMPLVKKLSDAGSFSLKDVQAAELFCKEIISIFPDEPPALLHGDLWAGNYMIASSGYAALYDPAVYYGHREMEIGMTKLFGGFDPRFYEAYHEVYPLEKNWRQRISLTQLYPILVHALLFGAHYATSAREIIRQFRRA